MVRKRSRKCESDENDSDSDADFDVQSYSRPAPKKYSLRERKRAFVVNDFDYYGVDEDDAGGKSHSSDDDDFEVGEESSEAIRPYFEPDPNIDPENCEGLIDFEDIIRADIVVNRNKIDYDSAIKKSEIKYSAKAQPKKRGRKPKASIEGKSNEEEENLICEPEQQNLSVDLNQDKNVEPVENPNFAQVVNMPPKESNPSVEKDINCSVENSDVENLIPVEKLFAEEKEEKPVEEDDDCIVLEAKQDVIVLDD